MTTTTLTWSPQQAGAIEKALAWAQDKKATQVFRLFGYAGTGKTTLAKEIAAKVDGSVLFAAFTGKASLVLQSKGCDGASTIHSLIYNTFIDKRTGEYRFVLNKDSGLAAAQLLIVDEVSMVGEDLARDLLEFGTKVLVLGDPAQLPPVKGTGVFINATPDVMLSEVHRQAQDSPIIQLSMDVREGRGLTPGQYGESLVVRRQEMTDDALGELVLGADQVLCGLNKTRMGLNRRIRKLKGIDVIEPVVGDRLVCLRNDREKGTLNGSLWDVVDVAVKKVHGRQAAKMRVSSVDNPTPMEVSITVPMEFFLGTEKGLDWKVLKNFDQFTYGYALTVHKSQGSQWDNVAVFDESAAFRADAALHLYTAITRAAKAVTVVVYY